MRNKIRIRGGRSLSGTVQASGAKNAALPILAATLLTEKSCALSRLPYLQDVRTMLEVLKLLGAHVEEDLKSHEVVIRSNAIQTQEACYELVRAMRASVLVLGPLLARFGKARVSLPGGCAIGARPIDYHLKGLEALGAELQIDRGDILASAPRGLQGERIRLEFPSVGATEQLMMAACLAKGETVIENAAREPEITDLAGLLGVMGAKIAGAGSSRIQIQGQQSLDGCHYAIMADRIEAGTLISAGLMTRGKVMVQGIEPSILEAVLVKLEQAGALVQRHPGAIEAAAPDRLHSVSVTTLPYPGFPTDMQAQFMSLMCLAQGRSLIQETVFENRFMHVPELQRLGAEITVQGNTAMIHGRTSLTGAPVQATDLRASASLILAGLAAEGETWIDRVEHLDRGYEKLVDQLKSLGADIERVQA